MDEVVKILNFQNAKWLREFAFYNDFYDWSAPDGEVYKRVQLIDLPDVRARIEEVCGKCEFLGTGFRLNYESELPNQLIHSDLGWGTHAAVIYLSQGNSGTAFWRHKNTGADRILPGQVDLFEEVSADWNNVDAWEQTRFIEEKFGRCIIYDGSYFHSRYPFEAYGNKPENGRLIAIAFFTPKTRQ